LYMAFMAAMRWAKDLVMVCQWSGVVKEKSNCKRLF